MPAICNIVFPEKNNKTKKLELDLTNTLEDLKEFLLQVFNVDPNEQTILFYKTNKPEGSCLSHICKLEDINITLNPTLYAFLRPVGKEELKKEPAKLMMENKDIEENIMVHIQHSLTRTKIKLNVDKDITIKELKEFYGSTANVSKDDKLEMYLENSVAAIDDSVIIRDLTTKNYTGELTLVAKMIFIGGSYGRLC